MCTPYRNNSFGITEIFSELCTSYDKTSLFLTNLTKLIVILISHQIITTYLSHTNLINCTLLTLEILIYLNLFIIFIILLKKPKYDIDKRYEYKISHNTRNNIL